MVNGEFTSNYSEGNKSGTDLGKLVTGNEKLALATPAHPSSGFDWAPDYSAHYLMYAPDLQCSIRRMCEKGFRPEYLQAEPDEVDRLAEALSTSRKRMLKLPAALVVLTAHRLGIDLSVLEASLGQG